MEHGGTSGWWRCCRWTSTLGTGWTIDDAVLTSKAGTWTGHGLYVRPIMLLFCIYCSLYVYKTRQHHSHPGIVLLYFACKGPTSSFTVVQVPHLWSNSSFLPYLSSCMVLQVCLSVFYRCCRHKVLAVYSFFFLYYKMSIKATQYTFSMPLALTQTWAV